MSKTYTNEDLKKNFVLTLQFYRDRQNILCLTHVVNKGSIADNMSMRIFGEGIANSKYLDEKSKEAFAFFCRDYLRELSKITGNDWLEKVLQF